MEEKDLTLKQKKAIAEYAAQLGHYDWWYYKEEDDTYGEGKEGLDETIEFIEGQHEIATNAVALLKELGLID